VGFFFPCIKDEIKTDHHISICESKAPNKDATICASLCLCVDYPALEWSFWGEAASHVPVCSFLFSTTCESSLTPLIIPSTPEWKTDGL